jgi:2-polyprenyl-3-methyl-5-hydroxy-6-metoxy-1,4-benzoquinol methylase
MFDRMAQLYAARYMNVDSYAEGLDLFCEQLPHTDANILELACGPGNITKYLLERLPKLKILATDLAPNMIELAKINCPTANFQIMDCRKLSELTGTYDAVIIGFCLPYLAKEEVLELVRSAKDLLVPGGIFYLSTMEGDYADSKIQKSSSGEEVFVHYYDRLFLEKTLQSQNLEVVKIWSQPDLTQKEKTTDLVFLAKKV